MSEEEKTKPKPRKGVLPPQELFQIKDLGRLLLKVSAHNGYLILVHFSPNLAVSQGDFRPIR